MRFEAFPLPGTLRSSLSSWFLDAQSQSTTMVFITLMLAQGGSEAVCIHITYTVYDVYDRI